MATDRDLEQDKLIRSNAERITRNEEAIKRQTAALEQIRDHYYPPPPKTWRRVSAFVAKVVCVVFAYAGVMETVSWYLDTRKADKMASRCAEVGKRLFATEGDTAGAVRFLERAVELDSGKVEYRTFLAFVRNVSSIAGLFDVGRPLTAKERAVVDAALAEATFLRAANPGEAMPHVLAAQAYALRGERKMALESVARAVELNPTAVQVRISACAICFFAGDFAGARRQIDAAAALAAQHPLVLFWRGMLLLTVDKDVASARARFEELVERAPRLALSHTALAQALLAGEKPDFDRAVAEFNQALVLDPKMPGALLGLGDVAARSGNMAVARLWYDRALGLDPHNMKALSARAHVSGILADWPSSVSNLTAAIRLAPFRADLYRARAAAYDKLGKTAEAASDLRLVNALDRALSGDKASKE